MKSSKAQITAKFHKIPTIRFEDQKLTSFSGFADFSTIVQTYQPEAAAETMLCAFEDFAYLRSSSDRDANHCSSAHRLPTSTGS